jgi:hypothetical protein
MTFEPLPIVTTIPFLSPYLHPWCRHLLDWVAAGAWKLARPACRLAALDVPHHAPGIGAYQVSRAGSAHHILGSQRAQALLLLVPCLD